MQTSILPLHFWADEGPFDLIGDLHGCASELTELLLQLGYHFPDGYRGLPIPPAGRKAVFLGDLVNRGPDAPGCLRLVMGMVRTGTAYAVAGNHDDKLKRYLQGAPVRVRKGLELTLEQLEGHPRPFWAEIQAFLENLPGHLVLARGQLVAAHAGLPERLHGSFSELAREIGISGLKMEFLGQRLRADWAADYNGQALVAYGHTPVAEPRWLGRTVNLDTGCVYGGRLTALRWPELQTVSVPARRVYYPGKKLG